MKSRKTLDRQHQDWMAVTATAVNPVHRVDGYKGRPDQPLIRPRGWKQREPR